MKKLVGIIAVFGIALFIAFTISDPKVQRSIEEKQAAKEQAKQDKQREWEEGWRKWYEDAKKKNAERKKEASEPGFDDGFRFGFMAGKLTRSKTNIPVDAKRIESLAQDAIQAENVPADSHAGFVRGFTAGWDFGWTSK